MGFSIWNQSRLHRDNFQIAAAGLRLSAVQSYSELATEWLRNWNILGRFSDVQQLQKLEELEELNKRFYQYYISHDLYLTTAGRKLALGMVVQMDNAVDVSVAP